jgi:hypothetical protein
MMKQGGRGVKVFLGAPTGMTSQCSIRRGHTIIRTYIQYRTNVTYLEHTLIVLIWMKTAYGTRIL